VGHDLNDPDILEKKVKVNGGKITLSYGDVRVEIPAPSQDTLNGLWDKIKEAIPYAVGAVVLAAGVIIEKIVGKEVKK